MARSLILIILLTLIAIPAPLMALTGSTSMENIETDQYLSFNELKGNYTIHSSRLDDLASEVPRSRAHRAFSKFIKSRYVIERFTPDQIEYDFISNTLKIVVEFPIKISRRRGYVRSTETLFVFIPIKQQPALNIMDEKHLVTLSIIIHMNRAGGLLLDDLRVYFRNEEIFRE